MVVPTRLPRPSAKETVELLTRIPGVSDNIQQKIEFIIVQHARFAVEIAQMKEVQRQQAVSIDRLTENMHQTREMLHDVIGEMREGFNNLIVAYEGTRKLAEDVGRLAIATSQRVTALESKLENKP